MDSANEIYVYENWKSDTPSLLGTLYVDGGRGKQIVSLEKALLNLIIEKVKKEKSVPEIAEALERDEASVARCVEVVSRYAPEYDLETILDEVLYGKKTDK